MSDDRNALSRRSAIPPEMLAVQRELNRIRNGMLDVVECSIVPKDEVWFVDADYTIHKIVNLRVNAEPTQVDPDAPLQVDSDD